MRTVQPCAYCTKACGESSSLHNCFRLNLNHSCRAGTPRNVFEFTSPERHPIDGYLFVSCRCTSLMRLPGRIRAFFLTTGQFLARIHSPQRAAFAGRVWNAEALHGRLLLCLHLSYRIALDWLPVEKLDATPEFPLGTSSIRIPDAAGEDLSLGSVLRRG